VTYYPDAATERLRGLAAEYLRTPADVVTDQQTGTSTLVFVPALTAPEQATLADLATMARFGVTLTLAEWQGIKTDAANLKAYLGVASPTAAQTSAATKAIIRVLGTIIRN
jgi:hypothetical protein